MNTTIKNQIIDYLQWSTIQYEDRYMLQYFNWCRLHGIQPSVVQELLANAKINNYFNRQMALCESNFIKIIQALPHCSICQLEAHYYACAAEVMHNYPTVISQYKQNPIYKQMPAMYSIN